MPEKIQYLDKNEIDKERWDRCIEKSADGLVYGFSIYLDSMADDWGGLVLNDYEAVMPLPFRKKYGVRYVYQPAFIAQLGVFGGNEKTGTYDAFIKAIPSKFRYIDLPLHHKTRLSQGKFSLIERANFILNLDKPYDEIFANYRDNIRRNINKSKTYGCRAEKDIDIDRIISIASEQEQGSTSKKDFERFKILYNHLKEKYRAVSYGIVSGEDQLLSSAVFFFSHKRAYYILVGNHPNGRTLGASHALIDSFIRDHSGRELILDFEGSDIRNLAFFYSSFGAVEERYFMLKWNRLPFGLKWLKK
jgi:hypothetical protein